MSCSDAFVSATTCPMSFCGAGCVLHLTLLNRWEWKWRHRHHVRSAWNLCKCTEFVWKLFYSIPSFSHKHTHAIINHARVIVLCLSKKLLIPHVGRCGRCCRCILIFYSIVPSSIVCCPVSRPHAVCFMQILPLCATMLLKNDNKPSAEQKKWLPTDGCGSRKCDCLGIL